MVSRKKIYLLLKNNKIVIAVLLIMLVISTLNLGYRNMWVDESINVVIGRNITKYGVPKVWDGVNLIGASGQAPMPEYTDGLIGYKYDFLPRYLAAFAQLFGSTNFAIRFPFVIMGVISSFCFFLLVNKITKSKFVIYSAFFLYSFSAQIIIYIRVAYYYAPVLLLMNLTYLFFINYMENNKYLWLYAASLIVFYHLNHLFFGVALLSTSITFFIFYKKNIKKFIIALSIVLASILPFVMWRNMVVAGYGGESNFQNLNNIIMQIGAYLWNIQAYIFPYITLFLILLLKKTWQFISRKKKVKLNDGMDTLGGKKINPYVFMFIVTILINIITISTLTYDYASRYLLGSIPACYILLALLINNIFFRDTFAKNIVIILLITTNLLNVFPYYCIKALNVEENSFVSAIVKPAAPFYNVPWLAENYSLTEYLKNELRVENYLYEYLSNVYSDYEDSTKGIRDFFEKYGQQGDSVYVFGNNSAAVIYYTDLKLVVPDHQPDNYKYPGIDLITENEDYIDWVIVTASGADPYTKEDLFWVNNTNYECYVLNYYNAPCLPELWDYYFELPNNLNRLLIYRNVKTTLPIEVDENMIVEIITQ